MAKKKISIKQIEDLQAISYLARMVGYHHLACIEMVTTAKMERRAIRLAHRFLSKSIEAVREGKI